MEKKDDESRRLSTNIGRRKISRSSEKEGGEGTLFPEAIAGETTPNIYDELKTLHRPFALSSTTTMTTPLAVAAASAAAASSSRPSSRQGSYLASSSTSGKWTCHSCTYENWPNASRCTMCRAIRQRPSKRSSLSSSSSLSLIGAVASAASAVAAVSPSSPEPPPPPHSTPSNQKWTCHVCTYENWLKSNRCTMCQTSSFDRLSPNLEMRQPTSPPLPPPSQHHHHHHHHRHHLHHRRRHGDEFPVSNEQRKETGLQIRQIRNRLTDNDWLFLNACQGILDNDVKAVEPFVESGGNVARQLTADDVLILNPRLTSNDVGNSLVHIALRLQRDVILALLLSPVVAKDALKRLPCHVNADLACVARKHAANCLRQRKGDWQCQFMTENVLFSLPSGKIRSQ